MVYLPGVRVRHQCHQCVNYNPEPGRSSAYCPIEDRRVSGTAAICLSPAARIRTSATPTAPVETPQARKEALVSAMKRKPREGEWTPEQDQALRDHAHLGKEGCAAKVGKTPSAILNRAHTLGVSLKKRPAPESTPVAPNPAPAPPTSDPAAWTDSDHGSLHGIIDECSTPATNDDETDDTRTPHHAGVEGLGEVQTTDNGDGTYTHELTPEFTPDEPAPKASPSCRGFGCVREATGEDGLCDECRSVLDGDLFALRECRVCGCTDAEACEDIDGLACHWVEEDLCSECAGDKVSTETTFIPTPMALLETLLSGGGPVTIVIDKSVKPAVPREHTLTLQLVDTLLEVALLSTNTRRYLEAVHQARDLLRGL